MKENLNSGLGSRDETLVALVVARNEENGWRQLRAPSSEGRKLKTGA